MWDERLKRDAERDVFTLTAFKPNYIMYTYSSDPNQEPYEFTGAADRLDEDEIKFHLSFQTKMADNLFNDNADVWFSYT